MRLVAVGQGRVTCPTAAVRTGTVVVRLAGGCARVQILRNYPEGTSILKVGGDMGCGVGGRRAPAVACSAGRQDAEECPQLRACCQCACTTLHTHTPRPDAHACPSHQELIQNADDAGAREVVFCLDTRQHGVDGLVGGLAAFQGPALLAFNSAQFTEDDFKSIRVGPHPQVHTVCRR
jgi:hypothetical protein